jgi:hypothetical protein
MAMEEAHPLRGKLMSAAKNGNSKRGNCEE